MKVDINIITKPAIEPVTLAEAKLQCHADSTFTDDDTVISRYISAARILCEGKINRHFITTTVEAIGDGFPFGGGYFNRQVRQSGNPFIYGLPGSLGQIDLTRAPVQSVTSIEYLDPSGVLQTLNPSIYRPILSTEGPGRIVTVPGQVFPQTLGVPGALVIRYVVGYGDTADKVPDAIKQAILLLVRYWYRPQLDNENTMEQVDALLAPYNWGGY